MSKRTRGDSFPSELPGSDTGSVQGVDNATDPETRSQHQAKLVSLDADESQSASTILMRCTLPPHRAPIAFSSYEDYEIHYRKEHVNRCLECKKNFPTTHYLTLHIEENHDPLARVRREKGERTYRCFVEGCEKVCLTPQKRRMHLIDKHAFPRMYNFFIVNDGLDNQSSLLRPERRANNNGQKEPNPRSKEAHKEGRLRFAQIKREREEAAGDKQVGVTEAAKEAKGEEDAEMEDLSASMSALKFVPNSVRLRRSK
ncbi:hypothetical protein KEM55_003372 [Ascosphaera atra]|nr:hypothetical protein KEM55_003372 [Ascosphaera atra]